MEKILHSGSEKRIQINAAATVFSKSRTEFQAHPLAPLLVIPKEEETELKQYAIEFKKFPVPEIKMREALDQLTAAILETLRDKGLIY